MFVLFTDSDTDTTPQIAEEYGYNLISMPYTLNGEEVKPYETFKEYDYKTYYNTLRNGTLPSTSAISPTDYMNYFEPFFQKGYDILYVHFSKNMSGTFNAMNLALEELKEKYPERTLYAIDTKGISICSLYMVKEIGKLYKNNASLEEILKFAENEVDHVATYFYVDDLKFFKRSGRVSNFSGTLGTILNIHPIIYMDSEGFMKAITKAKGKKRTLEKIVDYVRDLELDIKNYPIYVAHSDCEEIALTLVEMLKKEFGEDLNIECVVLNPTAGAHCGPDTVGVCFHAKHR